MLATAAWIKNIFTWFHYQVTVVVVEPMHLINDRASICLI